MHLVTTALLVPPPRLNSPAQLELTMIELMFIMSFIVYHVLKVISVLKLQQAQMEIWLFVLLVNFVNLVHPQPQQIFNALLELILPILRQCHCKTACLVHLDITALKLHQAKGQLVLQVTTVL